MAVSVAADIWAARRRRVVDLRSRQGFARQLLDFYGALLSVQEMAYADAAAASPPAESIAAFVSEVVVPRVLDVSLSTGPERLRSELIHRLEIEQPRRMVEQWIAGEEQPMVDRFLARASLEPVLAALPGPARNACVGTRDERHCPECGGPPQLAFFAPAPEDLASGPRRLLCARCGASWAHARMRCPGCGEDSGARLPIFGERGTALGERGTVVRGLPGAAAPPVDAVFPHMRIEACSTCRRYLLSVDMAAEPKAVPVVDEVAAIPLDLYARDRGFRKITTNLMGF